MSKYRYEGAPEDDPNRDASWMWRGTYFDPSIQFLNDVTKLRWDPNTRSYRAGYVQDGQWHWGIAPGFSAGGAGSTASAAAPSGVASGTSAAGGAAGAGTGVAGGTGGVAGGTSVAGGTAAGSGGGAMAWAPSAIQAGGQIGGAAIGGKGAKDAARIQQQSAREALYFEREKEAERRRQYQQAFDIWNASRTALLDRYGISLPASATAFPGAPPQSPNVTQIGPGPANGTTTRHPMPNGSAPNGQTLGDLAEPERAWSDWSRYMRATNG